jgi:hypothetical protein
MTKEQINAVLDSVRSWPKEDQEELAELAREIEARRTGVYILSDDERTAIAETEGEEIGPDEKVKEFWKRHCISHSVTSTFQSRMPTDK